MFPVHEKPLKLTRSMADCHMLDYIHYSYLNKNIIKINISRVVSECKNYVKINNFNLQRSKSNPI